MNCYKFKFSQNFALHHIFGKQPSSPMILVSGNIRLMRIFAGVPWAGASNSSGVVDDGNFFGDLCGYFFESIRAKTSKLHSDMLPLVCL